MMVPMRVSATFRLERCEDFVKIRSEAAEHVFDHVVGPNKKELSSNFSGQVPIAQVPGEAHQLNRIFMSDLDKILGSGLDP
jgi:hypothetical protein